MAFTPLQRMMNWRQDAARTRRLDFRTSSALRISGFHLLLFLLCLLGLQAQAVNPILPSWEYIPDGEPRVFGDRVYLYGSHDRAWGTTYCDYQLRVWSAPLTNLNEWVSVRRMASPG